MHQIIVLITLIVLNFIVLRGINSFTIKLTIVRNIFRKQASSSIMCGYFCIAFIDFMLARKTLTNFTNIFSPNNFKKMMIWF